MLSIVMPVYNERKTIADILTLVRSAPIEKEIILVDDGSKDGTREWLSQNLKGLPGVRVIFHEKNMGKGRAVQTGVSAANGFAVIIQDADLEYSPMDYAALVQTLEESGAEAVYGSRFKDKKRVTSGWHRFVNFFLTSLTNLLYGSRLTDMETCYKLVRRDVFQSLGIRSSGFEIEAEITAKLLKKGSRIVEVPISYKGRSYHEGKKIGWKDGVKAILALLKYRVRL